MTRLLGEAAADSALQFVVIVPTWQNQACYQELCSSAHLSRAIHLAAREHVYVHSSCTATNDPRLVAGVERELKKHTSQFGLFISPFIQMLL